MMMSSALFYFNNAQTGVQSDSVIPTYMEYLTSQQDLPF